MVSTSGVTVMTACCRGAREVRRKSNQVCRMVARVITTSVHANASPMHWRRPAPKAGNEPRTMRCGSMRSSCWHAAVQVKAAVVDRSGARVLRRGAILHRDDDTVCRLCELNGLHLVTGDASRDQSATVGITDARRGHGTSCRSVGPHLNGGMRRGAGPDREVTDIDVMVRGGLGPKIGEFSLSLPSGRDAADAAQSLRADEAEVLVKASPHLRVYTFFGVHVRSPSLRPPRSVGQQRDSRGISRSRLARVRPLSGLTARHAGAVRPERFRGPQRASRVPQSPWLH